MSGNHNKYSGGDQPAFPNAAFGSTRNEQQGMTLRDYFAAKALQGMSAEINDEVRAARWCYEMADAMMEARKQ